MSLLGEAPRGMVNDILFICIRGGEICPECPRQSELQAKHTGPYVFIIGFR